MGNVLPVLTVDWEYHGSDSLPHCWFTPPLVFRQKPCPRSHTIYHSRHSVVITPPQSLITNQETLSLHAPATQEIKTCKRKMSAAASKAWIVAASIGAVEALKDQGICRWNYTLRSLHQHAKNNIRSFTRSKILASSSSSSSSSTAAAAAVSNEIQKAKMKRRETSLEKTMNLSCWGPSTARF